MGVWECWLGLWGGGKRCWCHTQRGPQVVQVHLQKQGDSSVTIGEKPLGRPGQCSATVLTSVAHVLGCRTSYAVVASMLRPQRPTTTHAGLQHVCSPLHSAQAADLWVVSVRCSHLKGAHAVLYAPQVAVGALHHALAQQRCHDSLSGHYHTGLAVRLCCAGDAAHGYIASGRHWPPEADTCTAMDAADTTSWYTPVLHGRGRRRRGLTQLAGVAHTAYMSRWSRLLCSCQDNPLVSRTACCQPCMLSHEQVERQPSSGACWPWQCTRQQGTGSDQHIAAAQKQFQAYRHGSLMLEQDIRCMFVLTHPPSCSPGDSQTRVKPSG
jgi:hypothetical protein